MLAILTQRSVRDLAPLETVLPYASLAGKSRAVPLD